MAYSTSNPPSLIGQALNGKGKVWFYRSENPLEDVDDAGFFDNALELGMAVGDMVFSLDTGSAVTSILAVDALDTGGAADCRRFGVATDTG